MLFLEGLVRPLLVLHGLLGGLVVGLLTHHALWVCKKQADLPRIRHQSQRFIQWGAVATLVQVGLGLLIYPTYRVRVRQAHFDVLVEGAHPFRWLSGLFDLKEHLSSLLLVLMLSLLLTDRLMSSVLKRSSAGPMLPETTAGSVDTYRAAQRGLAVLAALLAWVVVILGLWVTSYRGLPTPGVGSGP